jgi:hypothetical protein
MIVYRRSRVILINMKEKLSEVQKFAPPNLSGKSERVMYPRTVIAAY